MLSGPAMAHLASRAGALPTGCVPVTSAMVIGPGSSHRYVATAQSYPGDPRATETCRQALALAELHDEWLVRAHAQWALGYDVWRCGDLAAAVVMIRAALENEQGFNDYVRVALMLEMLAWATTPSTPRPSRPPRLPPPRAR